MTEVEKTDGGGLSLDNASFFDEVAWMLASGRTVTIRAKGGSMFPFIIGGHDLLVMHRCGTVRRGDIVLARLDDGSCVLHRVVGVRDGSVILMGDGNLHARERCGTDDVLGHVAVVVKGDGREVDCSSTVQRCLAALWMRLLPVRRVLLPLCRLVTGRMTNQR